MHMYINAYKLINNSFFLGFGYYSIVQNSLNSDKILHLFVKMIFFNVSLVKYMI